MTKLLFFDIDGTLCMPGEDPTERTVSAIRRARANGHKCFLSTGRNGTSIPPALTGTLPTPEPVQRWGRSGCCLCRFPRRW